MGRDKNKIDLITRIKCAFPLLPRPGGSVSLPTVDDEGTAAFFGSKSWADCSLQNLPGMYASLWFFTPESFVYFIPAFMMSVLGGHDKDGVILDHMAIHFIPGRVSYDSERARSIIGKFTRQQRVVLADFLVHASHGKPDVDCQLAIGEIEKAPCAD